MSSNGQAAAQPPAPPAARPARASLFRLLAFVRPYWLPLAASVVLMAVVGAMHAMIALLVGPAMMFDLRLLGWSRHVPVTAMAGHLLPWSRRHSSAGWFPAVQPVAQAWSTRRVALRHRHPVV